MSNYAWLSPHIKWISIEFRTSRPISRQYQEIDDQIKIPLVFFSSIHNAKTEFDLFFCYTAQIWRNERSHKLLAHIWMSFYADSNDVCIHTFRFSHYIFAESMNFLCYSVCLARLLWYDCSCCYAHWVTWVTCFARSFPSNRLGVFLCSMAMILNLNSLWSLFSWRRSSFIAYLHCNFVSICNIWNLS